MLGCAGHDVEDDLPPFIGSSNVKKHEFIGTFTVVDLGDFDRIAGIANIDELHPLDHPSLTHVETGDDTFHQHRLCSLHDGKRLAERHRPFIQRFADNHPIEPCGGEWYQALEMIDMPDATSDNDRQPDHLQQLFQPRQVGTLKRAVALNGRENHHRRLPGVDLARHSSNSPTRRFPATPSRPPSHLARQD